MIRKIIFSLAALYCLYGCTGKTPVFKSADGSVLPRSIATIEKVPIGGINQTIIIRGEDTAKPLLLFVHGGPGMPEGGMLRKFAPNLEKMFVVVDWEQRGAGLTGAEKTPLEPEKRFIIFENSAHLAPFEEPQNFYDVLRNIGATM